MDKTLIAQGVANKLFAAEDSVDAALGQASTLLAGLLEARREMGLSAVAGDEIVAKVTQAISALSTARTAMVGAHGELADLKLRVGVRTKMFGVQDKPPEKNASYEPGLTVVSKAG